MFRTSFLFFLAVFLLLVLVAFLSAAVHDSSDEQQEVIVSRASRGSPDYSRASWERPQPSDTTPPTHYWLVWKNLDGSKTTIGKYHAVGLKAGQFFYFDGERGYETRPSPPPIQPPLTPPPPSPVLPPVLPPVVIPRENFGVDVDRIHRSPEQITVSPSTGSKDKKEIGRQEAIEIITKGLPEDRQKLRVTVIGSESACQQVVNDLKTSPALLPYSSNVLIQDYRPGEWALNCGFLATVDPTIYVQKPPDQAGRGKVLHRQDGYDGPEKLAVALRKADPSYNPANDPDLRRPNSILPSFDLSNVPPWAILAGAFGGYALLTRSPPPSPSPSPSDKK